MPRQVFLKAHALAMIALVMIYIIISLIKAGQGISNPMYIMICGVTVSPSSKEERCHQLALGIYS